MDKKLSGLILSKGRYTCPVCGPDGPRFESLGEKREHLRKNHPRGDAS